MMEASFQSSSVGHRAPTNSFVTYVSGEFEVMRLTPYRGVKAFGEPFGPRLSAAQLLGRAPLPNGRRFVDLRDVDAYPQAEPVYNATYYEGVEAEFKG